MFTAYLVGSDRIAAPSPMDATAVSNTPQTACLPSTITAIDDPPVGDSIMTAIAQMPESTSTITAISEVPTPTSEDQSTNTAVDRTTVITGGKSSTAAAVGSASKGNVSTMTAIGKLMGHLTITISNEDTKTKTGVKSRTKRQHTTKCRALNRHRYFPDSEDSRRIRRNNKRFLAKVEEYKQKKLIADCHCEEKAFSCLDDVWYRIGRIVRFFARLIYLLCCPPLPSYFFHKLAFWPPPRDYFFFYNNDPTVRKAAAVQTAQVKLRKANKEAMTFNNSHWRFGFEHECFLEISGADGFVVETKHGNFLGCVLVKSPHDKPRYTLLFSHPNGSDISDHLTGIPSLQDTAAYLNCNIVTYDYSGYGISSGRPNETNMHADIEAVYNHLINERNLSEDSIIFWGFSIGTNATVNLAAELDEIAGVILFAPPTSIVRTLCWKRCCCCRTNQPCNTTDKACRIDKFNTIGKINKINVPLLIIHGVEDNMVPIEHSQALYQHSNTKISPLWVPGVGHNNLENSELLWIRVREFIKNEAKPCLRTAIDDYYSIHPKYRQKNKKHEKRTPFPSHTSNNVSSNKSRTSKKSKKHPRVPKSH